MQRILLIFLLNLFLSNSILSQQKDNNFYRSFDTSKHSIKSKSDTNRKNIREDSLSSGKYIIRDLHNSLYKNLSDILETAPSVIIPLERSGITENMSLSVRGTNRSGILYVIDGIPYNNQFLGSLTGTIPIDAINQINVYQGVYNSRFGNAHTGIIEIATKSGRDHYFGGGHFGSSELTDAYGYNNYSGYFGGPLFPYSENFSFFGAVEILKSLDNNPRSKNLHIMTANIKQENLPENESADKRFYLNLSGDFGSIKSSMNLMGSLRDDRQYIHEYSKNNPIHNPRIEENVISGLFNLTQQNKYGNWNLAVRYHSIENKIGDGVWFNNFTAYGDSTMNSEIGVHLPAGDGTMIRRDTSGVFYDYGRVYNRFEKYDLNTYGLDLYYNKQFGSHSVESGFSIEQSVLRYFEIFPVNLSILTDSRTIEQRYYAGIGRYYGYDIFGKEVDKTVVREVNSSQIEESDAKNPIKFGFYIQDRFMIGNFTANLGLRYDHFDPNFKRLKKTILGYDGLLTKDDFESSPSQDYLSPRIKTEFKVNDFSKIYAGYGIFRLQPNYSDIYDSWSNIKLLESMDHDDLLTGHIKFESLIQIELGFMHKFSNWGSLDFVLFQNNLNDAITSAYQLTQFGATLKSYITRINANNVISVKGFCLNFNLWKWKYFIINTNYNYYLNTTIDSNDNSSFVSAFRNNYNNDIKVYANYNWNVKHSLKLISKINTRDYLNNHLLNNINISIHILLNKEELNVPGEIKNIQAPENPYDQVKNTAELKYTRFDLMIHQQFELRESKIKIIPYLSIYNLFNNINYHRIYPGTLKPDDSGFLETPHGQHMIITSGSEGFASDYRALERNPTNYDIPRLIRLGLKVKF